MADNRKRASREASRLLLARVRFAATIALPLPRASASAPRQHVRSEIATATTFRLPRASLSKVAVLLPRRYALVFPSSARLLPRAGSAMPPCRAWSTTSTLQASALSMCRARSSMRCRAMALTRALRSRLATFPYADVAVFSTARVTDLRLFVVLDHVTDDGNFGAIARSAEVVGAAGVVVAQQARRRCDRRQLQDFAGAVMHLPIAQVPNIAVRSMTSRPAGFWVGGASEHAEGSCWDAPFEGRVALVMGSEGDGISRLVLEKCDFLTKLPQRGMTESLNVAQATTALCFEWLRRNAGELMGEE